MPTSKAPTCATPILDRTNVFGASRRTAKIGAKGLVEIEPGEGEGDPG
ncbi:MAG: hypothetical protein QM820_03905 [Minicystis sp.]